MNSSEVHTVIGTLEELSMDRVVLLSDNGNELAFSTDDVKIDLPSGIRIGQSGFCRLHRKDHAER